MSAVRRWLGQTMHDTWLRTEELRLLGFARHVVLPDGMAAWLDDDGKPDPSHPEETWITGRMAHIHYLASLRGVPGADPIARLLLRGLATAGRDREFGGWNDTVPADPKADKAAYTHAFVILAASTGTIAGDPAAQELLTEVLELVDEKFWDPKFGRFVDTWSHDWSELRGYRGINANMHMTEAMLAATDATGDPKYAARSVGICEFVLERASKNGWRVPEHFNDEWVADLEYNKDSPADQFKPYGATVGHAFEWSRLIAQAAPLSKDPKGFLEGARSLFAQGIADGWARDGQPGFVYTVDWNGKPVVSDRLHWVVAEAIAAAAVLHDLTGLETYASSYAEWWDYAATYLIDIDRGSWHHQLDADNRPSSTVWDGKPDVYHAYQAVLISQLPPSTSVASAVQSSIAESS
ncbi:MAG TPA: AGE family epimerase/isomerase [Galbitalea sp.]|jgi:mannose/cellobiose epimerase-like protein (N-acyl-D-glucosamine 2-epimerase family)|nr:AGE family epimerase/isomerase [Galbitalea sp.]